MAEEVDRGARVDLKIGGRYLWTNGYLEEPVTVWAIGSSDALVSFDAPEFEGETIEWVPRIEIEPLDD